MNHQDTDFFSIYPQTGEQYAGRHILADFWGVERMGDPKFIEDAISKSALKAGAHILHSYYHPFGEGMGVSGVTVLAESHISIHTWPEREFASIDIFMCGNCNPEVALGYLVGVFKPTRIEQSLNLRGTTKLQDVMAA